MVATLRDAKEVIATQMGVAVPINLLLFVLGTALFLFYKQNSGQLTPMMKTDGIYPFFVAQQFPPGVSGLGGATLLAATMSTISSTICSVANLGIGAALFTTKSSMPWVWDLALLVTNLAGNGVVGLFGLGLLTTRANQSDEPAPPRIEAVVESQEREGDGAADV